METGKIDEKYLEKIAQVARLVQSRFPKFYLAGGTAIMLKHRHRLSTDLDFFHPDFSTSRMLYRIRKTFGVSDAAVVGDSVVFTYSGIKTSFICFPFENVAPCEEHNGIVMASDLDLLLNKLYSIGRRIEWRDYYDFAFLLRIHRYNLKELKELFERKFSQDFELFAKAASSIDSEIADNLPQWVPETLSEFAKKL